MTHDVARAILDMARTDAAADAEAAAYAASLRPDDDTLCIEVTLNSDECRVTQKIFAREDDNRGWLAKQERRRSFRKVHMDNWLRTCIILRLRLLHVEIRRLEQANNSHVVVTLEKAGDPITELVFWADDDEKIDWEDVLDAVKDLLGVMA